MIIFNTTYSVSAKRQNEWLQWLKEHHFDFLDATGMVQNKVLSRVIGGEHNGHFSYSLQIYMTDTLVYQEFEKKHLPQCEAQLSKNFGTDVVAFSTLLKVL